MAHSLIQGCAVILVLGVILQPVYLKSFKSETIGETQHADRIRRQAEISMRLAELADPSPCPDGKDYCETTDDYPTNLVKDLVKIQSKFILSQFFVEVDDSDLNKFFPSSADEHQLCTSSINTIFPTKAKSKEGFIEFIVNVPNHSQGVRVEYCVSSGNGENSTQCNIPGNLATGYTSRCEQKHIQRTLVVVDKKSPGGSGLIAKPFDFPSCCSCVISL